MRNFRPETSRDSSEPPSPRLSADLFWVFAAVVISTILALLVAIFGKPPYVFYANLKLGCVVSGFSLIAWLVYTRAKVQIISLPIFVVAATHGFAAKSREDWLVWNWLALGLWTFALGWIWYGRKIQGALKCEKSNW
ncbi:hypothetical protein CCB80_13410 [Armatimonadetes bacterium Uphvl-Ar1]|nr:hypothetical protein CCB80_13410 [Armatimonadetes bacterium Uphvl-Ar1]